MTTTPTEPGWYADPEGEAAERRWDGTWLDVTRGPAGDGRPGGPLHVTDLDYLEALSEHVDEIRRIVKFWGVVIPITFAVGYAGLLIAVVAMR
jgi:hypothetical protein